jgi:hypothetical protein
MADYPVAVYVPRTKENKYGVVYNPLKTKTIYAEDVTKLDDEVVAIETTLGENPQGAYDTVAERLDAVVGGGATLTVILPTETADGTRTVFTFAHSPIFLFADGQGMTDGNGFALAGGGPFTATFDNPPTGTPVGFYNAT